MTTPSAGKLQAELAAALAEIARLQDENAEHRGHAAKCHRCQQWTCGFCGSHDEKGQWWCNECAKEASEGR